MKRIYSYLYYRLLFVFVKGNNEFDGAILTSLALAIILFFNIMTLGVFLRKLEFIPWFINTKFQSIALILTISFFNIFIFCRNKHYQTIYEFHKHESRRSQIIGSILIIAYGLISFGLFTVSAIYFPGRGLMFAN